MNISDHMALDIGLPRGLLMWINPIQYWIDPDTGQTHKRTWKHDTWTDWEPATPEDIQLMKEHFVKVWGEDDLRKNCNSDNEKDGV